MIVLQMIDQPGVKCLWRRIENQKTKIAKVFYDIES